MAFTGNVISFENPATGEGFVWLRLAPSAAVRVWDAEPSLVIQRDGKDWLGIPGTSAHAYETARIEYTGGSLGRIRAMHSWQRKRSQPLPGRDGLFLTNTWGDRSRADKLSEAFVKAEIERAAEMGVEVVQLDDGWQKGRSSNTVETGGVWNDFWATQPDYWTPDPERFPSGLGPLVEYARQRGIRLGLWYAPDSSGECANWESDAELILDFWRQHGITHFKLDAVKLLSPTCEERFRALLDRVQKESASAVLFDLDTTAEARLGFWGRPEGATIFVENRYSDWGTYYPHHTLRALWSLCHTIHPARLRMELLNPHRNGAIYGSDPLRPSIYRADYLFATVMASSPLGWFENTGLPSDFVAEIAPLVALWKQYRAELHGCDVIPIGDAPSGYGWTGFAFMESGGELRHLLVFRETTLSGTRMMALPPGPGGRSDWRKVAGEGEARVDPERIELELQKPRSFLWMRNYAATAESREHTGLT